MSLREHFTARNASRFGHATIVAAVVACVALAGMAAAASGQKARLEALRRKLVQREGQLPETESRRPSATGHAALATFEGELERLSKESHCRLGSLQAAVKGGEADLKLCLDGRTEEITTALSSLQDVGVPYEIRSLELKRISFDADGKPAMRAVVSLHLAPLVVLSNGRGQVK